MARRQRNSKPIIAVILRQIDAFLARVQIPDEHGVTPVIDLAWEWTSPNGQMTKDVTRAEFEGQNCAEGWPFPGTYRVFVVDENGDADPRFDAWEAEHVDKDMIAGIAGQRPEEGGGLMGAMHGLLEEHRITVRDMRRELDAAKRREADAEDKRRIAQTQLVEAQNQTTSYKLAAERANADKEYAEAKQKEAEEAYRELERSVNAFEPQIKAGVDRLVERVLPQFAPSAAGNDDEPASQERVVAPAPDGDDSPERAKAVIDDTFEALFTNIDVIRPLVESGIVKWGTVRYVIWKYTGKDVGEQIDWTHWESDEEEASDAG